MPALRTTSLLSIKPAFVKGGEVVVPVMIHVGEWAELAASPAIWNVIMAEVAAAPARAAARKRGPRAKPRCTGCDNPGCADCVASSRPPVTKPNGSIL